MDLAARAANGRRLEERLVELLRTRTGKLQDVLSVERELARVREEIERMEGRLRFSRPAPQLSTLSVSLYEPLPHRRATQGRGRDRRGVQDGLAQLRGGARGVDRVPRLSGADRRARLGRGRVRAKVAATGERREAGRAKGNREAGSPRFPFHFSVFPLYC